MKGIFEIVDEETEKSSLAIRISPYSEKVPLCQWKLVDMTMLKKNFKKVEI